MLKIYGPVEYYRNLICLGKKFRPALPGEASGPKKAFFWAEISDF